MVWYVVFLSYWAFLEVFSIHQNYLGWDPAIHFIIRVKPTLFLMLSFLILPYPMCPLSYLNILNFPSMRYIELNVLLLGLRQSIQSHTTSQILIGVVWTSAWMVTFNHKLYLSVPLFYPSHLNPITYISLYTPLFCNVHPIYLHHEINCMVLNFHLSARIDVPPTKIVFHKLNSTKLKSMCFQACLHNSSFPFIPSLSAITYIILFLESIHHDINSRITMLSKHMQNKKNKGSKLTSYSR